MKVIVTGASGVLGTAAGHDVLGLAHSRPKEALVQLDLLDPPVVEKAFTEFRPDYVAAKLNADLPARLAHLAAALKYKLVYISTDYVFDGSAPPYAPAAQPSPVNLYGRTKRDGELAVLAVPEADAVVLRVPVLYGPAPKNSDTAVNILLDVVQDQSGKQYKMDHYATRFPTNTVDIGAFLVRLVALAKPLPRILHYSAPEPFTKYEMCLNCQLDTAATEELLGGPGSLECSLFQEWWAEHLGVGKPEASASK
ncbi:NAD-binding protein [Phellopilus nigrolimitatus]|nr:NAD-binding protein [Phellopilus nigrolimitatus]